MALPFRRSSRSAQGASAALTASAPSPTLRKWQVAVLLWPLSPVVREALAEWLLDPTDLNRWPPPATFAHQRWPLRWEELRDQPLSTLCVLLYDELKVIRQTLDFPPEALSVLTHNGLLIVHAIRLRQLERWLWPKCAAREIKKMIA